MAEILMFSSGMDSLIMKIIFGYTDRECLFVDMGTNENMQEAKIIDQYFPEVKRHYLPLARFELHNKIIPFRNQILCYIGAQYGSQISFAFTAGDTTRDKDFVFKAQMEGSLNYFCGIPEKSPFPGEVYSINIPFKTITKSEMLKMYIDKGHDVDYLLSRSVSCYEGKEKQCGGCRSCLRKFVALVLNEVEWRGVFVKNPADRIQSFYEESKRKNRSNKEIKEIERCINILKH